MNKDESVATIIYSSDRQSILLVLRRDIPVWVLPGGGIDSGETPAEAALREVKEETGLNCQIKRKIALYSPKNKLAKTTHFFEGSIISGTFTTNSEVKTIRFFPLSNLPYRLPPPYPEWIQDAQKQTENLITKSIETVTYFSFFKNLLLHPILVFRFILSRIGMHINS